MNIESPEFRMEDGTRARVQLYLFFDYKEIRYRISDLRYCEPRKRTGKSLESSFRDNFDYRQLNQDERRKYEIENYASVAGIKAEYERGFIKCLIRNTSTTRKTVC